MTRVITVLVVDKDGVGLNGYKVNAYGGEKISTDNSGKAQIIVDSERVSIYVNGRTEYEGSTSRCENPLIVNR